MALRRSQGIIVPPPMPLLSPRHALNVGLIGWWPLTEAAGTIARDIGPYQNNGALANYTTRTTVPGRRSGVALSLDGSTQSVSASVLSALAGATAASISVWLYRSVNTVAVGVAASSTNPYRFSLIWQPQSDGNWYGFAENGSTFSASKGLSGTGWRHFVLTFNGAANSISFYQDGLLKGSNSGGPSSLGAVGNLGPPTVGLDNGTNLGGSVSNFRVWNRILNAAEVLQLYNNPFAGMAQPRRRIYRAAFISNYTQTCEVDVSSVARRAIQASPTITISPAPLTAAPKATATTPPRASAASVLALVRQAGSIRTLAATAATAIQRQTGRAVSAAESAIASAFRQTAPVRSGSTAPTTSVATPVTRVLAASVSTSMSSALARQTGAVRSLAASSVSATVRAASAIRSAAPARILQVGRAVAAFRQATPSLIMLSRRQSATSRNAVTAPVARAVRFPSPIRPASTAAVTALSRQTRVLKNLGPLLSVVAARQAVLTRIRAVTQAASLTHLPAFRGLASTAAIVRAVRLPLIVRTPTPGLIIAFTRQPSLRRPVITAPASTAMRRGVLGRAVTGVTVASKTFGLAIVASVSSAPAGVTINAAAPVIRWIAFSVSSALRQSNLSRLISVAASVSASRLPSPLQTANAGSTTALGRQVTPAPEAISPAPIAATVLQPVLPRQAQVESRADATLQIGFNRLIAAAGLASAPRSVGLLRAVLSTMAVAASRLPLAFRRATEVPGVITGRQPAPTRFAIANGITTATRQAAPRSRTNVTAAIRSSRAVGLPRSVASTMATALARQGALTRLVTTTPARSVMRQTNLLRRGVVAPLTLASRVGIVVRLQSALAVGAIVKRAGAARAQALSMVLTVTRGLSATIMRQVMVSLLVGRLARPVRSLSAGAAAATQKGVAAARSVAVVPSPAATRQSRVARGAATLGVALRSAMLTGAVRAAQALTALAVLRPLSALRTATVISVVASQRQISWSRSAIQAPIARTIRSLGALGRVLVASVAASTRLSALSGRVSVISVSLARVTRAIASAVVGVAVASLARLVAISRGAAVAAFLARTWQAGITTRSSMAPRADGNRQTTARRRSLVVPVAAAAKGNRLAAATHLAPLATASSALARTFRASVTAIGALLSLFVHGFPHVVPDRARTAFIGAMSRVGSVFGMSRIARVDVDPRSGKPRTD